MVKNNGSPVTYTYNDEGIRTGKTVNGVTHTYHLSGSQIIAEEIGNELFVYMYDADGSPIGMQYTNTSYTDGVFDVYWYEKNLQGDIIYVCDEAGNKVISYTYDAWGNVTATYSNGGASTSARYNPFKYRGYYHDSETGFYYLNSRYYDSATGRFISADGYVSTGTGMLGYNMFAYCNNNPVNYYDPTGESVIALIALGAVGLGLLFIPSDVDQGPKYEQQAKEKYNSSTIDFYINELGTADDKVNVTFYPEGGLIHIENSYSIRSEYEKRAIISEIMSSQYYDKNIYGNCVDTMLIEWSAHNFVYRTSTTSKLAHDFFVRIGYPNPIESSTGVDFRKSLAPSVMRNYNFVTLWGNIQW